MARGVSRFVWTQEHRRNQLVRQKYDVRHWTDVLQTIVLYSNKDILSSVYCCIWCVRLGNSTAFRVGPYDWWWLKQNLVFNAEYRRILHNFTEMLFLCGRGMFVWGKLHRGNQIWVAQQVTAPSTKKSWGTYIYIYPSVKSQAVPERLLCVRWTVVLQRSRPEKS